MLTLYRSGDLNALAERLLGVLSESPKSNPLQPDRIILQNNRMKRWLQQIIARKQGIAANIEADFPGEFIWNLYRQMDEKLPETLPSEREPMAFSIFDVLQSGEYKKQLQPLYNYIETDIEGESAERAWNLSVRVADLFDRYQIYRPEMILSWQRNKLLTHSDEEKWQAALWQMLQKRWGKQLRKSTYKNRAELYKGFLKAINEGKLTEPINIFAVADLAPAFLETFIALSKIVDVNFYRLDVNQDGSERLVELWGKKNKEFAALFDRYVQKSGVKWEIIPIKSQRQSSEETDTIAQSDGISRNSIQVHSCHSPIRETEVLYDQLLNLFDRDPELNPADVLIITPDIETYAPFIHSVFGSPDKGQPGIPYHISDHNPSANPVIQSFLKLLALMESRFKVSEVLDLLFAAPVREAFDISEDEADRLERWIDENNLRWGIDASFKETMALPASEHFTLQAGLNRMMLGTAMQSDDDDLMNRIFPYSEIATSADAVLAGKLSQFLHKLFSLYKEIQKSRRLDEWATIAERVLQNFLSNAVLYRDDILTSMQAIEKLREQKQLSGIERNVPFKIVHLWLRKELEMQSKSGIGTGRGVTFSSMIANRSIPYKMIGMLGMNDDAFPRRNMPVSYDLMNATPRTGDPDRLEEDRYLFLEVLMSAGWYNYFSYVGQSNRENVDFPPSVLITELLDHVQSKQGVKANSIIQKHPLQNFSSRYFKESNLFTYSKNRQKVAHRLLSFQPEENSWLGASLSMPGDESKDISLTDLIAYYSHSAKFVLTNRLNIYISNEEALDDDREPFVLKGLNKYGVEQDLLERYLREKSLEDFATVLSAQDRLPEGWAGQQGFEQKVMETKVFADEVLKKTEGKEPQEVEINLEFGEFNLTGKISGFYDPLFIDYRFGRSKAKYIIAWWIKHLALYASDEISAVSSIFLTFDKGKIKEEFLPPVENAKAKISELVDGYWSGIQRIGYFFPESSYAYAANFNEKDNGQKARKATRKKWETSHNGWPGEGDDRYVKLMVGDENPIEHTAFEETALRFWNPFLEALKQGKR